MPGVLELGLGKVICTNWKNISVSLRNKRIIGSSYDDNHDTTMCIAAFQLMNIIL